MAVSLFFDIFGRDQGVSKMLDEVASKAEGAAPRVAGAVKSMAVPAAGVVVGLVGVAGQFGQMAAAAEQSSGAVENVFGSAASKVEEFASRSAGAVGLSTQQYNELSAVTGTALKAAGVSVDDLAAKNDELITRGADMASVFGGTTVEAVSAMGSAFRGEMDPLERYGVTLTMAQVNAELAARGQDDLGGAAGEAAKKQAIMDIVMQQSAGSAGNFAKEADTATGAQERGTAAFADAGAKLGEVLLPAMTFAAEAAAGMAKWVGENSGLVTILAGVIGGLAAAIVILNIAMGIASVIMMPHALLIGGIILAVVGLIAVIVLLIANWDNVVKFLSDSWTNFTKWFGDGMNKMGQQWSDFWGGVGSMARDIWNNTLGPVFDTMSRIVTQTIPQAFRDGVTFVAEAWNGLREVAKAPVRFVIDTVINDGLIGAFNTVAGFLPGVPKLGRVALPPGFRDGGYTGEGGKNDPAGIVHAGEFVFTKEETQRAGVATFQRLSRVLRGFANGGFVNPAPTAVVSQGYGPNHNGIDLAAAMGTPIRAAFDGNVTQAAWSPYGGGNEIHIQHAGGWSTWYAHLSRMLVKAGQVINRGMQIGLMGSTGNSTGSHLHYMVLNGGWPNHVNPGPFMGSGSDIPAGGTPFNPIAGIIDGLIGSFRSAFPGGGMVADVAIGVGRKLLGSVGDFIMGNAGTGSTFGPKVFDQGGWMDPGTFGVNRSNMPEAVFTQRQLANLTRPVSLEGMQLRLNADMTMGTFERIASTAADRAITDANNDLYRGRAR